MKKSQIIDEIIEMAWQDEISFQAIESATGCSQKEVMRIMRNHLKPGSYRCWRKRVRRLADQRRHKSRSKSTMENPVLPLQRNLDLWPETKDGSYMPERPDHPSWRELRI